MKRPFAGDGIRFEVDDAEWQAFEKWDETSAYRAGLAKLDGSAAVDFVGVKKGSIHFIEAKVYTGTPSEPYAHAIENKKAQVESLPHKVACKVRDTIAGLVAAHRSAEPPERWLMACVEAMRNPARAMRVVVWIVEPDRRPGEPETKRKANRKTRDALIRAALSWLKAKVTVLDPSRETCVTELDVRRLPMAP